MNLKKSIFGFGAAAALSLSVMTGAMAADNTANVAGTVDLNKGVCNVTVTTGTANFGSWTWDGSSYTLDAGSNATSVIKGTVTAGEPSGTCAVVVTMGAGLSGSGGNITPDRFTGSAYGYSTQLPAGGSYALGNVPAGNYQASLTLDSVPNTFAPDTYTGTIAVVAVTAN